MEKIILVRMGEIFLKGLNRNVFENKLILHIKRAMIEFGGAKVILSQSRIYVEPNSEDFPFEKALIRLTKVFGIVSISPVAKIDTDFETMVDCSIEMIAPLIERFTQPSFKVETKRGEKRFSMDTIEINTQLGGRILEKFPQLKVDVHKPDITIHVEVRESTYIYSEVIPANGGLPSGTNGRACLMLSGGIDSPVAGFMVAKRGVELNAVHFYSYPYTSERAKEKVITLTKLLSEYSGKIKLFIVPFTDIQLAINEKCCPELGTIIMRRSMMRIAEHISRHTGCSAMVTGESIGQVASQTMQAIYCTDLAAQMPVFRPLIGMDKMEVVDIARRIGTYETSILPYEDCCTVFVAKHPKTRPNLNEVVSEETKFDFVALEDVAYENVEIIEV